VKTDSLGATMPQSSTKQVSRTLMGASLSKSTFTVFANRHAPIY